MYSSLAICAGKARNAQSPIHSGKIQLCRFSLLLMWLQGVVVE